MSTDRDQTPAFGFASSLEAMVAASMTTSIEGRISKALDQQLTARISTLEDRIRVSVNAMFEQRLNFASLDGIIQSHLSKALEKENRLLSASLETKIHAAVDTAVQRWLGNPLRAQIILNVPVKQIESPTPSHGSSTLLGLSRSHSMSVFPYLYTTERDDNAALKQEVENGDELKLDKPTPEIIPMVSSSESAATFHDGDTSAQEESLLLDQLTSTSDQASHEQHTLSLQSEAIVAGNSEEGLLHIDTLRTEKASSPIADLGGSFPQTGVAALPLPTPIQAPEKPRFFPGMGIDFSTEQPSEANEDSVKFSVDEITEEGNSLFVDQDEVDSAPAQHNNGATELNLPATKDRPSQ